MQLLDLTNRPVNAAGPTIDQVRADAQREADAAGVDIAIGWQVNDTTGEKELGYCPAAVAPNNAFVIEVLETVQPYRGGRANHEARQDARRERLESAAARARAESESRFKAASGAVAGIPPGQPILVGHHSERRHRRALEKHDTNMRAAFDADARAKDLAGRAASVGDGGISSDDPQAVSKLRQQLADLEAEQTRMKETNKVIRSFKVSSTSGQDVLIAAAKALVEIGHPEGAAARLVVPDFCGRIGYPDYRMKNNNANIRRIRQRVDDLLQLAQVRTGVRATSKSGVVYQVEDNRVQLVFDGKPSYEIRERLKSAGFRWAPSAGAWQRHLNNAGDYAARQMIKWLDEQEVPSAQV